MSDKKNVVLGVTGGIAAYKALDVVSKLKKQNINVDVIITKSACEFIKPLSFQSLSQNPVICDTFAEPKYWEIAHISLAKKADLIAVVPATANIIGKVANGIADDMLSTTIMATKAQVIFSPAMNTNMYENKIVQDNIKKLKKYGYQFINPASGRLACGDVGNGKLEDTEIIVETIIDNLNKSNDLFNKKVLVTAGPTIAPIDPVRYITNKSSGKMGYAIAKEAKSRGADVTLISGPTNLKIPNGLEFISVKTNEEMLKAVLENFDKSDIVIKSAAVADYKPEKYSENKIKKNQDEFSLKLIKNTDILKKLGQLKKKQILIGFAAESENLLENARKKLKNKNLDYIVANNILLDNSGFQSDNDNVTIISKSGEEFCLGEISKRQVAKQLFNLINKKR